MNIGYVYIGLSSLGTREWRIGWHQHLTYEQIRFLRPYFEGEYDITVNNFSIIHWSEEMDR